MRKEMWTGRGGKGCGDGEKGTVRKGMWIGRGGNCEERDVGMEKRRGL